MKKRQFLKDADPAAFDVLLGFERYLAKSPLDRKHAHLIKIRVSQLNGCSYCIDKHIDEALKAGEDPRRIFVLAVWHDTPFFSDAERALLALVEEITTVYKHGISDAVYDRAIQILGQEYTTATMMAAIAMNAWNRVGITTGREPQLIR